MPPQEEEMPTPGERQTTVAKPPLTRDQYRIRKLTKENARLKHEVEERDNKISRLQEFHQALEKDLADEKEQGLVWRKESGTESWRAWRLSTELSNIRDRLEFFRGLADDKVLWPDGDETEDEDDDTEEEDEEDEDDEIEEA
ncbi:uncharacterized protein J4E92_003480 [Alternaria infectoria]|uniref:uncharacterized protein n=1 Tax=Alternaria infectoria TaxID=45303 RepID=UPI002220EDB5|nr:uncharacterized protein J4E92_003480 [Alternaria infectoria]KAI4933811.1 hypothetical protein J4E92_003480 [Alternaria infectoria]